MHRALLLLLLPACAADPLREVYATEASGHLTLFQVALVEGYQLGWGEVQITGEDGEVWSCPARLRGSETGLLGEVGLTEMDLSFEWAGELRADRIFSRYWGVEAAAAARDVHHELRAVSARGVTLRGSADDGGAIMAMANLTSVALGRSGECGVISLLDAAADTGDAD